MNTKIKLETRPSMLSPGKDLVFYRNTGGRGMKALFAAGFRPCINPAYSHGQIDGNWYMAHYNRFMKVWLFEPYNPEVGCTAFPSRS